MTTPRTFLLLQGVCSPFFYRLGQALRARGHRVFKLNFNGGDWLYWFGQPAWSYRGSSTHLASFLADTYQHFGITDQILFGDCRPIHRPAIALATTHGIRTHVTEEGYFRPHWVTLERDGVNGYSRLPKSPDWYRAVGKKIPEYQPGHTFTSSFTIRAVHDVIYHLAGFYNPLFFPGYRTHAPVNAAIEYMGYIRRLPLLRFHRQRDDDVLLALLRKGRPYYLLPLQLSSDAQIRHHSSFNNMAEVIKFVIKSFAQYAPTHATLVIKNHPLDAGLDKYPKMIRSLQRHFSLHDRIQYMETGNLPELLNHAAGTVTVNSTVGMTALAHHCPTMALSKPIYQMDGLTFQGPLDAFWKNSEKPDDSLFKLFRKTVIHATQVNGGFYSSQGIDLAVANMIPVLEADSSPLEHLI